MGLIVPLLLLSIGKSFQVPQLARLGCSYVGHCVVRCCCVFVWMRDGVWTKNADSWSKCCFPLQHEQWLGAIWMVISCVIRVDEWENGPLHCHGELSLLWGEQHNEYCLFYSGLSTSCLLSCWCLESSTLGENNESVVKTINKYVSTIKEFMLGKHLVWVIHMHPISNNKY